jgi:hypothetical protein
MARLLNVFRMLTATGLVAPSVSTATSVTLPEDVQPYMQFTIEVSVPGLKPPNGYVFVDVVDSNIVIGHQNRGPLFINPPPTPFTVTVDGLPPGEYGVTVSEMNFADSDVRSNDSVIGQTLLVPASAPPIEVFAFFNEEIEHYFVTASFDEAVEVQLTGWDIVD